MSVFMKKLLCVWILVVVFSCKQDNEDATPQANVEMKATISLDNFTFNATQVIAIEFQEEPTLWYVTGTDDAQNSLQLTIPKNATIGTHSLGNNDDYAGQFFKNGDETYTDTDEGNITISEKTDNLIKGTFSFKAQSPFQIILDEYINVTNGTFTVVLE